MTIMNSMRLDLKVAFTTGGASGMAKAVNELIH